MKQNALTSPIEYFLWSREGKTNDKLIYYDQDGNCHEKPIPTGIFEQGLGIFDGKPKAVRRSSGGLVLAEPYQIVVYDRTILTPENSWRPVRDPNAMIRIRVRFYDLVRSRDGLIISHQPIIQTKIVLPHELKDSFSFTLEGEQNYVMDFGNGIVPIHVFHFNQDAKGRNWAFFTLEDELKKCLSTKEGRKTEIQVYQVPRDVIRYAEQTDNKTNELVSAIDNLMWLRQTGTPIVPNCLRVGDPIQVPGGSSMEMVTHFLRISVRPEDRAVIEPLLIRVKNSDELLPFGIFETA